MTNPGFAKRLQQMMGERRLTQTKLAQILFVSRQAVGRWLDGVVPHRRALNRIVMRLGVSEEWLLAGKGEPYIPNYSPTDESWENFGQLLAELSSASQVFDPLVNEYDEMLKDAEKRRDFAREKLQNLSKLWRRVVDDVHKSRLSDPKDLTTSARGPRMSAMAEIPNLKELLDKVRAKTSAPGARRALAKWIPVSEQQLSRWLSVSKKKRRPHLPNAAYALRLLQWVKQPSAQQKQIREGAETPSRKSTQSIRRSIHHEKPRPKRSSRKSAK
jgi:transcriptional regulator with XRE-family HTH domain